MLICLTALLVVDLSIIASDTGLVGFFVGSIFAAVTAFGALSVLMWVDRHEPEPGRWLTFAFLWGGSVAVFGALILNTYGTYLLVQAGFNESAGAVFIAPWVEEALKALGLLAIIAAQRHEFDGIVDSIVYTSMVAIGFATIENIQYFGIAMLEDGFAGVSGVFFARGILSPFAHPFFTLPVGVMLGLAAYRRKKVWWALVPVAFGFSVAGHALWNYFAVEEVFLPMYIVLMVPMFAATVAGVLWFRQRERKLITTHLTTYQQAGWFSQVEVDFYHHTAERKAIVAWAKNHLPADESRAISALYQEIANVAVLRHRLNRGTAPPDAAKRELVLLQSIVQTRPFVLRVLQARHGVVRAG